MLIFILGLILHVFFFFFGCHAVCLSVFFLCIYGQRLWNKPLSYFRTLNCKNDRHINGRMNKLVYFITTPILEFCLSQFQEKVFWYKCARQQQKKKKRKIFAKLQSNQKVTTLNENASNLGKRFYRSTSI